MRTVELRFPEAVPTDALATACEELGLRLHAPTTLLSYPGSVHWHISRSEHRGVLEITWWPQKSRFWFKIAANRDADWINEAITSLSVRLG